MHDSLDKDIVIADLLYCGGTIWAAGDDYLERVDPRTVAFSPDGRTATDGARIFHRILCSEHGSIWTDDPNHEDIARDLVSQDPLEE